MPRSSCTYAIVVGPGSLQRNADAEKCETCVSLCFVLRRSYAMESYRVVPAPSSCQAREACVQAVAVCQCLINRVVPRHATHVIQPSVGKMLLILQSVLAISLTIRVPGNCAIDAVKSSGNSGSGNPRVVTSHSTERAKEACVQAYAVCTLVLPAVRYVAALTLTGHCAHML
jgi:hypothetical protein